MTNNKCQQENTLTVCMLACIQQISHLAAVAQIYVHKAERLRRRSGAKFSNVPKIFLSFS